MLEKIETLISDGKLKKALKGLGELDSLEKKTSTSIILIKGQLATLEREFIDGTYTNSEYQARKQEIKKRVLQLIDDIRESKIDDPETVWSQIDKKVVFFILVVLSIALYFLKFKNFEVKIECFSPWKNYNLLKVFIFPLGTVLALKLLEFSSKVRKLSLGIVLGLGVIVVAHFNFVAIPSKTRLFINKDIVVIGEKLRDNSTYDRILALNGSDDKTILNYVGGNSCMIWTEQSIKKNYYFLLGEQSCLFLLYILLGYLLGFEIYLRIIKVSL